MYKMNNYNEPHDYLDNKNDGNKSFIHDIVGNGKKNQISALIYQPAIPICTTGENQSLVNVNLFI